MRSLAVMVLSLASIISACLLASHGIHGWPWFLVIGGTGLLVLLGAPQESCRHHECSCCDDGTDEEEKWPTA